MDALTVEEVINLESGKEVTYNQRNALAPFNRPMRGVVQYVRRVSNNTFNVMIAVKGNNIIANTGDYVKNWYLTK